MAFLLLGCRGHRSFLEVRDWLCRLQEEAHLAFKKWCKRKNVKPRYGAVGRYGSVSVIERFIKSMKNEGTRKIRVPLRLDAMRREMSYYVYWYNHFRPHSYLEGETPYEVYGDITPANSKPRYEPRSRWPRGSPCASPLTKIMGKKGSRLVLVIGYFEGRKHLPVIELKRVALFYLGHFSFHRGVDPSSTPKNSI